jgi:hypothetical protein
MQHQQRHAHRCCYVEQLPQQAHTALRARLSVTAAAAAAAAATPGAAAVSEAH